MAITNNMWLRGSKKKIGGTVYYQAMGQTRHRELAASVTNPRTASQMQQRVKWANLVNLYRANQSWMKYAFETKKTNQSEYNKWMSLNVTSSRIYLPKQIAAAGGAVVDAYICTQGSLPSVEWSSVQGGWVSNIFVGPSFEFSPATTIGDFSQVLLAYNPAIREGDQLSFIRMTQMLNSISGAPYVIVRKYEFLVKPSSQVLLSEMWPLDVLSVTSVQSDRAMSFTSVGKSGGFAVILSRTISGKTYVSTQSIQLVDMAAFISAYSSEEALAAAIASYGDSEDAFLSSNSAQSGSSYPVPLSLLGRLLTTGELGPSGTFTRKASTFAGAEQYYKFNGPLTGLTISSVVLTLADYNEYEATSVVSPTDPSVLNVTFPTEGLSGSEILADRVTFIVDGVEFLYRYVIEFSPGGME